MVGTEWFRSESCSIVQKLVDRTHEYDAPQWIKEGLYMGAVFLGTDASKQGLVDDSMTSNTLVSRRILRPATGGFDCFHTARRSLG